MAYSCRSVKYYSTYLRIIFHASTKTECTRRPATSAGDGGRRGPLPGPWAPPGGVQCPLYQGLAQLDSARKEQRAGRPADDLREAVLRDAAPDVDSGHGGPLRSRVGRSGSEDSLIAGLHSLPKNPSRRIAIRETQGMNRRG